MSALGHADAAFRSGAPSLAVAESSLLLLVPAFGALGRAVRDADALDAHRRGGGFVPGGVEGGVASDQTGIRPNMAR